MGGGGSGAGGGGGRRLHSSVGLLVEWLTSWWVDNLITSSIGWLIPCVGVAPCCGAIAIDIAVSK